MSWPGQDWFRNVFGFDEIVGGGPEQFPLVHSKLTASQLTASQHGAGVHVLKTKQGKYLWVGRYTQQSLGDLLEQVKVRSSPLHAFPVA